LTNRLISGQLQLSQGTILIIDETELSVGKANQIGLEKLGALYQLLNWQKLDYNFEHFSCDFATDIPTVILSHGTSLLCKGSPMSCVVPLQIKKENLRLPELSEDLLHQFRLYLGILRTMSLKDMSENVSEHVQNDFVETRQQTPTTTHEDLHLWLNLARYSALSFGEEEISIDRWNFMKNLERTRRARIQSSCASKSQ